MKPPRRGIQPSLHQQDPPAGLVRETAESTIEGRTNPLSESKLGTRSKPGNRIVQRVAVILVAVIVLILVAALVSMFILYQVGSRNLHIDADDRQSSSLQRVHYDEGRTIRYDGSTYELNPDVVSICVIGFDRHPGVDEQGQADSVMVAAIDTQTGKITVIVIPRDSMVDVSQFAGMERDRFVGMTTMQLCLSYMYGDSDERSSELTTSLASRILYNIPISYYFSLNQYGIGDLADAIGGVTLTPIQTIPHTDIKKGEPITLSGENAYIYCERRDIAKKGTALSRQKRDMQFLKAYAEQAFERLQDDPATIFSIFGAVSQYSYTNLGIPEIIYLTGMFLQNTELDFEVISLQGEAVETPDMDYAEFYLDEADIYKTVLDVYYTRVGE